MKRIIMLLVKDFPPDPRVYREAKSLGKAGYNVKIFAWKYESRYPNVKKYQNFKVYHLGPKIPSLLQKLKGRMRTLFYSIYVLFFYVNLFFRCLSERFDFCHAHDLNALPVGVILKLIKEKPLVYDSHEYYPAMLRSYSKILGYLGEPMQSFLCKFVDKILTTNTLIERELKKYHKPISLVSNYVDLNWFDSHKERINLRKSKPIVLYQGIMKKRRGVDQLVKAKKFLKNTAEYVFIGAGPYLDELRNENLAQRIPDINIVGKVPFDHVPSYIRRSDVGVNLLKSSFHHKYGTPNKLYEYMAGGIPVVVSNLPEMTKIVKEGKCGLIIDPTNPRDIAKKIDYLLKNEKIRKEMGKKARLLIEKKYNWGIESKKLVNVYKSFQI